MPHIFCVRKLPPFSGGFPKKNLTAPTNGPSMYRSAHLLLAVPVMQTIGTGRGITHRFAVGNTKKTTHPCGGFCKRGCYSLANRAWVADGSRLFFTREDGDHVDPLLWLGYWKKGLDHGGVKNKGPSRLPQYAPPHSASSLPNTHENREKMKAARFP